ncbi:MAG TPA: hypothetical protein VFH66_06895 [Mycobacteriales bacterium]|nr:hypothetical protein [Mycobacteriales bacterium]
MDTPAQDAAPLVAAPGLLLDDRYRLDQLRADHQPPGGLRSVLWRAVDDSLGRYVAVQIVSGSDARRRRRVVKAATRASTLPDARFVRVYDVGEIELDGRRSVWIAYEWVEAPTLAAVVRDEPLPPPVATDVVRQCAEAIQVAADAGISHGRLHPDQVHLPATGAIRISGLATAAIVHDVPADEAGDVRSLGGLLFAALTGRWPLTGWQGLPVIAGAAAAHGRPRVVRAGVPRELDTVTADALTGRYGSARALARALATLPSRPIDAVPEPAGEPRPDILRRWLWRLVPPLLVVTIGIAGWVVGSELGRVPLTARQPHAALPPAQQTGPRHNSVRLVWRQPPTVTSFDPGGDGQENPDATALAVDRDPTTAWTTDTYRNDPHLGGLKPGVGLLLDLGRARTVQVADLVLSAAGADIEIRAGDRQPTQAGDLPLVARRTDAPASLRVNLTQPVTARYWLLWFTKLPADNGGFRVGVAEVALLG